MKTLAFLPLIALFAFVPPSGFCVDLEELILPDRAAALKNQESMTEIQFKNLNPTLLPNHEFTRETFGAALEELDPGFLTESLFLYAKPENASREEWLPEERLALYNRALALSSLEGLQYFSASRQRMRTFYEESAVIDSLESKKALPDPVYTVPPEELTIYALQRDLTFGENVYAYTYFLRADAVVFMQENLTPMRAGIIPAVGKGRLRSIVAVIDAGPYLLIYVASMAKAVLLPGLNKRVGDSFSTRAEAVIKWYSAQADAALLDLRRP